MALTPGATVLNKYRILHQIGEGGSGRVWLAEETTFSNRQVAIKAARSDLPSADLAETQRYFQQELKLYTLLEEAGAPNLVRAFTVESYEGNLLLVMAYMPGGDLATLLRQEQGMLAIDLAVAIIRDILTPLQVAHNHPLGIVHRDIKPQNILLDANGKVYLADWGLAQLSGVSGRSQLSVRAHPGSPLYMAPEQARSTDYLTPAADIYAVGCLLFELLTGKPYKRVRPGTVAVVRADTPPWLDQVLGKALTEDPFDRYEDAAALITALAAVPSQAQPAAKPANPIPPPTTRSLATTSSRRWVSIGGVIIALLAGFLLYNRYFGQQSIVDQSTPTAQAITLEPTIPVVPTLTVTVASVPTLDKTATAVALAALTLVPTNTPESIATATATPTPNHAATHTAQNDLIATSVAAALTALPTATPEPTITPKVIPISPSQHGNRCSISANPSSTKRVQFAPGAIDNTVTDSLLFSESKRYIYGAQANQIMTVNIRASTSDVIAVVSSADGQEYQSCGAGLPSWSGVLPSNQDYYVTVAYIGSEKNITYSLEVIIVHQKTLSE